jgi:hypothetical protein
LAQAATKLDLSENDIVRHALGAAVNAIEGKAPLNEVGPILASLIFVGQP